jgi:molecular chaperone HscA
VEANRLIAATQSALASDADLLDAGSLARIQAAISHVAETLSRAGFNPPVTQEQDDGLKPALQKNDTAAIEAVTKALGDETEAFAAERMNASIQKALAGKAIASL